MRRQRLMIALTGGLVLTVLVDGHSAIWNCPIISTAGESNTNVSGTLQNLGQSVIGRCAGPSRGR